jgi:predicted phosphate transport protein (TIGR00153 family)
MHLLPHDDTFFELLDQQAALVCKASEVFASGLVSGYEGVRQISGEMKMLEEHGDEIVQRLSNHLRQTFLTPFDPENVQALTSALDDVLDAIEDATFLIVAFRMESIPPELVDFSQIIRRSCTCLRHGLENIIRKQPVAENCMTIGELEKEADRLQRRLLTDLFQSEPNPIILLKRKELFEAIEAITDRCDDVANLLENVSVKG